KSSYARRASPYRRTKYAFTGSQKKTGASSSSPWATRCGSNTYSRERGSKLARDASAVADIDSSTLLAKASSGVWSIRLGIDERHLLGLDLVPDRPRRVDD